MKHELHWILVVYMRGMRKEEEMKLPRKIVETIDVKSIEVHAKVCDSGSYTLKDSNGNNIAIRDDYVPSFFPEEHYGDYLILNIDLESGKILNWKTPIEQEVSRAFNLIEGEDD